VWVEIKIFKKKEKKKKRVRESVRAKMKTQIETLAKGVWKRMINFFLKTKKKDFEPIIESKRFTWLKPNS
jgi:hypothetical protein